MPIVQFVFAHDEIRIGLENDEICVEARGNAALASIATGQSGWLRRHPAREIEQGESAPAGLSPHQRQCD